jgi:tetratricopeptide (TPR) repeat protein
MKSSRTALALVAGWLLIPPMMIGSPATTSRADDKPTASVQDKARNETLRQIVAEIQKALDASDNKPFYYFRTLRFIAEVQAKLGDREAAEETLRRAASIAAAAKQAIGNNSYGLSSASQLWEVGHAQVELGDREGARATLVLALQAKDEQDADFLRIGTLAAIAKEFTAIGAHDKALQAARQADINQAASGNSRDDELVVPEVAAAHAAAGDIEGAFKILDGVAVSARHPRIKQVIITRALGKIAQAVDTADRATARSVLDRVRRRLDDVPNDDTKYAALIELPRALARIGDVEGAMQAARLNPRTDGAVYAMNLIAGVQNQAGDREGARKTLRQAYETARQDAGESAQFGRLPQVASGMIDSGDLADAWRCVEDMKPGDRSEILAKIASAQKKRGDPEEAAKTFRRALVDARSRHGIQPRSDDIPKAIAKVQAMMGDYDAARKTTDAISDPIQRVFALARVVRAQAAGGDARGALEWCRKRELPPRSQNPLEDVIQGIGDFVDSQAKHTP